jgi:hypothetical protein
MPKIKTIADEIAFWKREAENSKTDAAFAMLGIAYGLEIAQRDYMQKPAPQPTTQ